MWTKKDAGEKVVLGRHDWHESTCKVTISETEIAVQAKQPDVEGILSKGQRLYKEKPATQPVKKNQHIKLVRRLMQENGLNLGGGGCSEPTLLHCTVAWATGAKLHIKRKEKKKETKHIKLMGQKCKTDLGIMG
ncbi:Dystrophin, partial [Plecturocebus cupreus]